MFCREELRLFIREEMKAALENMINDAASMAGCNTDEVPKKMYMQLLNALHKEFDHD